MGQNSCLMLHNQLQKQDRRQSIASSREGILTPSYKLTFALGENSFMCMGQIGGRALLLFAEGIFTPSYELTFALGENSCKCFTWVRSAANASVESIAVYQATNSQSEQLVALGENDCKCASTVLACYILAVQYSASVCSMAQCSFLFLNERTGLQKTSFFKMNIICLALMF